jgi:hypothetical protein
MGTEARRRPFSKVPMLSRMVGAGLLDRDTFEEVSNDSSATIQAVAVVVMAGLAIGFGVGTGYGIPFNFVITRIVWWAVWVFLAYLLLPAVFRIPEVEWGSIARTTGFAQAPALLLVLLNVVPGIGQTLFIIIVVAVGLWWMSATTVAIRQSLRLRSNLWAAAVAVTWFIPSVVIELVGL